MKRSALPQRVDISDSVGVPGTRVEQTGVEDTFLLVSAGKPVAEKTETNARTFASKHANVESMFL